MAGVRETILPCKNLQESSGHTHTLYAPDTVDMERKSIVKKKKEIHCNTL